VSRPILYSFRRCLYAMRARLALVTSGVEVGLREVRLRDKPAAFLDASPSATVPCLVTGDGVIDESLDIMVWALRQNDPEGWLDMPNEGWEWIARCDGPFKSALDRSKYTTRYPEADPDRERDKAAAFLRDIEAQLDGHLFGSPTLADVAILPFVRQFAYIDRNWFDAQDWSSMIHWLDAFLASPEFEAIMPKVAPWRAGEVEPTFPFTPLRLALR
jgi:glutathione S-transferase